MYFVRQPEQVGLGDAILCAERVVGNEPFAVLLADDFIVSEGKGVTAELVKAFEKNKTSQISVMAVEGPDISNYGVVKIDKKTQKIIDLIEKPEYRTAPSNLASIGRYILTPDIFQLISKQQKGYGKEVQLADAIGKQAKNGLVNAVPLKGKRFDCGSIKGYLNAISYMAKHTDLTDFK